MGTRKTDLDIRREQIALDMSEELIGTGISVSAGGGGYTVMVIRLDRQEMDDLVRRIRGWRTGGED